MKKIFKEKQCSICNKIKDISNFNKVGKWCKPCRAIWYKEYRKNNLEQIKLRSKKQYIKNKENIIQYRVSKKEHKKEYDKKYRSKNRQKISRLQNEKRKSDPIARLRHLISNTVNKSIKKNNKSIIIFLDYSIEKLKIHLESLFESWMNWNNYGGYKTDEWSENDSSTWKWNIDHIVPQSLLPYSSMEDENFKKCWDLSNLRPLSAKQNLMDGNRR